MKNIRFLYPGWKNGAVTFGFDDNRVQDRRLVALFNQYGLKGTFNLNTATLSSDDSLFIRREEVKDLYAGHEVASHSVTHANLLEVWGLDPEKCRWEILHDREELAALSGQEICGFVFPYGEFSAELVELVRDFGFIYTRCGTGAGFTPPADLLYWIPAAHQNEDLRPYTERFLACGDELRVLVVWGHSFEFDWGKGHWDDFEVFCRNISGRDDMYCATMRDICKYWIACRALDRNADTLQNDSALELYLDLDGEKVLLPAGGTLSL